MIDLPPQKTKILHKTAPGTFVTDLLFLLGMRQRTSVWHPATRCEPYFHDCLWEGIHQSLMHSSLHYWNAVIREYCPKVLVDKVHPCWQMRQLRLSLPVPAQETVPAQRSSRITDAGGISCTSFCSSLYVHCLVLPLKSFLYSTGDGGVPIT